MAYRIGVKPGKAMSAVGMAAGVIFIILGVTMVIPVFGLFGLFWTAMAGVLTFFFAFNFFSRRGLSTYEIEVDSSSNPGIEARPGVMFHRLLRADGEIAQQEFRA